MPTEDQQITTSKVLTELQEFFKEMLEKEVSKGLEASKERLKKEYEDSIKYLEENVAKVVAKIAVMSVSRYDVQRIGNDLLLKVDLKEFRDALNERTKAS